MSDPLGLHHHLSSYQRAKIYVANEYIIHPFKFFEVHFSYRTHLCIIQHGTT